MTTKITHSSELMSNYMLGQTVAGDKKFESIQADNGFSLLFSIGSDDRFYLTEERPMLETGWQKSDLTESLKAFFPGQNKITAKTFATAQDLKSNNFAVALVVNVSGKDHLFIAAAYKRDDAGFLKLSWTDYSPETSNPFSVAEIYILQTATDLLIVADTLKNGSTSFERYYIDVDSKSWKYYPLPMNMKSQNAKVCAGRRIDEYVNGIYTLGTVGSTPSVVYQQIYDPFDPESQGKTTLLSFPETATPNHFASTVSVIPVEEDDNEVTDLYVSTAEGDLYFFAANKQFSNTKGLKILNNDLFRKTLSLYAYTQNKKVTVWGHNAANEVFYTQCDIKSVTNPQAWSFPLPIGKATQISPYVNRKNGGNTFFALTANNTVKKVFQDPISTIWTSQSISLAALDPKKAAERVDCYMTRITITDENNQPLPNIPLKLSSAYRMPVHIDNQYIVLDTEPVAVKSDSLGVVRIVQRTDNMQGAILSLQRAEGGEKIEINPMGNVMTKIAGLSSATALKKAEIVDFNGKYKKNLVNGASDADLENAADAIQALVSAYHQFTNGDAGSKSAARPGISPTPLVYRIHHSPQGIAMKSGVMADVGHAIVVAAGDLCRMLKDATNYIISIVVDVSKKIWSFIVEIAGIVYTFVIDTTEKVIDAIVAIFNALKTLVIDLLEFLVFLFGWSDIIRTNDVMKNVIRMYLNYGMGETAVAKRVINDGVLILKQSLATFANLPAPKDNLTFSEPASYTSSQSDYAANDSTPANYLQDHLLDNIADASFEETPSPSAIGDLTDNLIQALKDALEREKSTLNEARALFHTMLFENDKYKSMSVFEILKVSAGIVANTILDSVGLIIDLVIDLVVALLQGVIDLLFTPIYIPIFSDIMSMIGFNTFSIMDVICFVGAVPATLTYKLKYGEAPYPENDVLVSQIIKAKSLQELEKLWGPLHPIDLSKELYSMYPLPKKFKDTLFMTFHTLGGTAAIVTGALVITENIAQLPYVPYVSYAKSGFGMASASAFTAAGCFAQPYPIQDKTIADFSTVLGYLSGANIVIGGVAPKISKFKGSAATIAYVSAASDILLSMTAMAPVAFHYMELSNTDSNTLRTLAFMDETAKILGYLGSISSDVAKFDPDPATGFIIACTSCAIECCNASIQLTEVIVQ